MNPSNCSPIAPCEPERVSGVDGVIDQIVAARGRYAAMADAVECAWYLVAALHWYA